MKLERTNAFEALALVGPRSTGSKANPHRRQLQRGSSCLRVNSDGLIVIDEAGPARIDDTTQHGTWLSRRFGRISDTLIRFKRRVSQRLHSRATASRSAGQALPVSASAKADGARSRQTWNRVGLVAAFIALFTLGIAVQHRAEIVNCHVLRQALEGRLSATQPGPLTLARPSNAGPATQRAAAAITPILAAAPTRSATPTPIPGRPLDELPDALPSLKPSLPDPFPPVAHRRVKRASEDGEQQERAQEDAVTVVIRNKKAPATPESSSDAVDVSITPPKASADQAPAPHAERAPGFQAVTANGGALVVRIGATNKFHQVAPGERLPNGQTLTRINEDHSTYTTDAGTFNYREFK